MCSDATTIRPGVAGIVSNTRGKILLHRRPSADGWAPPSGAMEPGEDVRFTLKRELREETRLEVDIERFVGIYSDPQYQIVHHPDRGRAHFVTSLFLCSVGDGRLDGSSEGTAWGWFAPKKWPTPLLPYAERWLTDALANVSRTVVK